MRFAAAIEYDGSHFHGWQEQGELATVQREVERALSDVADETIKVICAGRTDASVHATQQIIHFDSTAERPLHSWLLGANSNLPQTISIRWVVPVSDEFHARFSANMRRYHYYIYNHPVRSALLRSYTSWQCRPLDVEMMQNAAQHLVGEHDFSSFRASACQAHSPVRRIDFIDLKRDGDIILLDIQANAFLQHMVRNIAGVLMKIGSGKAPVSWAQEVLNAKARASGGVTAEPNGLYLVEVGYPAEINLPIETQKLSRLMF
jgi:tRNA pseudouridine38-40 synthase